MRPLWYILPLCFTQGVAPGQKVTSSHPSGQKAEPCVQAALCQISFPTDQRFVSQILILPTEVFSVSISLRTCRNFSLWKSNNFLSTLPTSTPYRSIPTPTFLGASFAWLKHLISQLKLSDWKICILSDRSENSEQVCWFAQAWWNGAISPAFPCWAGKPEANPPFTHSLSQFLTQQACLTFIKSARIKESLVCQTS